jgi:hypothetical protein
MLSVIRRPVLWRFLVEIGPPDFGIGALVSAQPRVFGRAYAACPLSFGMRSRL